MLAAVDAVKAVVGTHDRPRFGGLHRDFKASQIDFPQGAIIDDGVHVHAAEFLVVDGEVFKASADTLRLDPVHQGRGDLSAEHGVFGKVFKIPAAQGAAFNVHPRAKQHAHVFVYARVTQGFANGFHQRQVPGTGQG